MAKKNAATQWLGTCNEKRDCDAVLGELPGKCLGTGWEQFGNCVGSGYETRDCDAVLLELLVTFWYQPLLPQQPITPPGPVVLEALRLLDQQRKQQSEHHRQQQQESQQLKRQRDELESLQELKRQCDGFEPIGGQQDPNFEQASEDGTDATTTASKPAAGPASSNEDSGEQRTAASEPAAFSQYVAEKDNDSIK